MMAMLTGWAVRKYQEGQVPEWYFWTIREPIPLINELPPAYHAYPVRSDTNTWRNRT